MLGKIDGEISNLLLFFPTWLLLYINDLKINVLSGEGVFSS